MPKYYVESGRVRLVLQAEDALAAAVKAFQWTCDKQAEIEAASPLELVQAAEEQGWQLDDEVWVNERGFGRLDGDNFDTAAIVDSWLACPVPLGWTEPGSPCQVRQPGEIWVAPSRVRVTDAHLHPFGVE